MKVKLAYVTSSKQKQEEIEVVQAAWRLDDDQLVGDVFEFDIRQNSIDERLEIDLEVMVKHEVIRAYELVKVPCIVEHAGLVFDDFRQSSYPGGLTKPMWNALGTDFLGSVRLQSRGATAQAVVGYCDGMRAQTFLGRTHGELAVEPRGSRNFYWDTIFVPDDPARPNAGLTYAEIVDELGLEYKVVKLSQSTKAMGECLKHIRMQEANLLWP